MQVDVRTKSIFPVPLTMVNFGKDAEALNTALVNDIFNEKEQSKTETRSAVNGWQSVGGLEKKYSSFAELSDVINKVIESILASYNIIIPADVFGVSNVTKFFRMGDLWANVLEEPGAFHMPHIHGTGETIFSGVYWPTSGFNPDRTMLYPNQTYDYEETTVMALSHPRPGDLVLFDPAADAKRQVIPGFVGRFPYYGQEICIQPKKSFLIIFPNYLTHMVAPLMQKQIRMSISFAYTKI